MKAMTDIKEGIKPAPVCGYSAMNDLFRFGCLHLDRLITADCAFIPRTHKFTSVSKTVSSMCCLSPSNIRQPQGAGSGKSAT